MKAEPLVLHELECVIDTLRVDAPAAIDDPGLVDLVLGEAMLVQEPRPEIAVDHAHGGVAEHQAEHAPRADLTGYVQGQRGGRGRDRRVIADLFAAITNAA